MRSCSDTHIDPKNYHVRRLSDPIFRKKLKFNLESMIIIDQSGPQTVLTIQ